MPKNRALMKANKDKQDEFYTQLPDIEKELSHYKKHFKGKTILCNCDDPRISNFFKYFSLKFEALKLKKLITTCYKNNQRDLFSENTDKRAIYLEYNGVKNNKKTPDIKDIGIQRFKKDGDFRSEECIEILKQSDIVVTNPPFSLFREYVAQLMKYKKKFIIIGNLNSITSEEVYKQFKENKMWFGVSIHSGDREFGVPDYYPLKASGWRIDKKGKKFIRVKGVRWFTNIDHKERHKKMEFYEEYNKTKFPKYDNYDAINIDKTKEIPEHYKGAMGVPITFMDKYNPEQFEIIDANDIRTNQNVPFKKHGLIKDKHGTVVGESNPKYARLVIKHKRIES